jgi:hypothetical protein
MLLILPLTVTANFLVFYFIYSYIDNNEEEDERMGEIILLIVYRCSL